MLRQPRALKGPVSKRGTARFGFSKIDQNAAVTCLKKCPRSLPISETGLLPFDVVRRCAALRQLGRAPRSRIVAATSHIAGGSKRKAPSSR
jgi:hypothetical protein